MGEGFLIKAISPLFNIDSNHAVKKKGRRILEGRKHEMS